MTPEDDEVVAFCMKEYTLLDIIRNNGELANLYDYRDLPIKGTWFDLWDRWTTDDDHIAILKDADGVVYVVNIPNSFANEIMAGASTHQSEDAAIMYAIMTRKKA